MFPFFLALYNGSQVSIVALWATCFKVCVSFSFADEHFILPTLSSKLLQICGRECCVVFAIVNVLFCGFRTLDRLWHCLSLPCNFL